MSPKLAWPCPFHAVSRALSWVRTHACSIHVGLWAFYIFSAQLLRTASGSFAPLLRVFGYVYLLGGPTGEGGVLLYCERNTLLGYDSFSYP
jgi:hypothetical protein